MMDDMMKDFLYGIITRIKCDAKNYIMLLYTVQIATHSHIKYQSRIDKLQERQQV